MGQCCKIKIGISDEELEELQGPKLMKILFFSLLGLTRGKAELVCFKEIFEKGWEIVVVDLTIPV